MEFEWDEEKAQRNQLKHGVSFEEGKTIFNDPFAITIPDPAHSQQEERWIDVGFSAEGRLLVVWYTERSDSEMCQPQVGLLESVTSGAQGFGEG